MWTCQYSENFSAQTFGAVLRHIAKVHQFEPNFKMSCAICSQTFVTVSGYKFVSVVILTKITGIKNV